MSLKTTLVDIVDGVKGTPSEIKWAVRPIAGNVADSLKTGFQGTGPFYGQIEWLVSAGKAARNAKYAAKDAKRAVADGVNTIYEAGYLTANHKELGDFVKAAKETGNLVFEDKHPTAAVLMYGLTNCRDNTVVESRKQGLQREYRFPESDLFYKNGRMIGPGDYYEAVCSNMQPYILQAISQSAAKAGYKFNPQTKQVVKKMPGGVEQAIAGIEFKKHGVAYMHCLVPEAGNVLADAIGKLKYGPDEKRNPFRDALRK